MKLYTSLGFVFALVVLGVPQSTAAAAGTARPHACGSASASRELVEPPDVEVGALPLNAAGAHELILAVHKDGDKFCYHYTLNGAAQTIAPTIRVRQGERFAIRIVNDISGPSRGEHVASTKIPPCMPMGMPHTDTLYHVGYLNHTIDDRYMHVSTLDTNLHLHGFEGPASEENVFLSTLSTPMHACEYDVAIPHTQPPGTYVYHPHLHGSSELQVAGGLEGAWIVEPDAPQLPRSAEHVIMLRYRIPFAFDNNFAPDETALFMGAVGYEASRPAGTPAPFDPFSPPPWPVTYPMQAGGVALDPSGCNGLGSEVKLALNGSNTPASLQVPAGQPQLLRIVNGTSDSATRLQLRDSDGRIQPIRVVALDGVPVSGDLAHPLSSYIAMNDLMLTSMSRADVLLTADGGTSYMLSSEHYCEGKEAFFQMHHDLLQISATPGGAAQSVTLNSAPAAIAQTPAAKLVAYARANPSLVKRRALTFTEYAFPKNGKVPVHQGFYITETTNPDFHEHPFWPAYASGGTAPSNADVVVKKGTVEEWYLINAAMESHAFHIHQMTFVQEKSWAGVPVTTDTVFVPIGKLLPNKHDPNYPLVQPSITKILLDFRHVPRGTFVFHCHMLFHEDRGMMAIIRVV
jgi:FtsP/CotA-like multicopper oxidase with cupredoxin domain